MGDRAARHATGWGTAGSVVAALCCLGAAPLVAALGAVGLGFLIDDRILLPLLALFLAVTVWGLERSRRAGGSRGPARLGWLAALGTLGGLWISGVVVAGLSLLVVAAVWNAWTARSRRRGASTGGSVAT